jgi:hypothetical protein
MCHPVQFLAVQCPPNFFPCVAGPAGSGFGGYSESLFSPENWIVMSMMIPYGTSGAIDWHADGVLVRNPQADQSLTPCFVPTHHAIMECSETVSSSCCRWCVFSFMFFFQPRKKEKKSVCKCELCMGPEMNWRILPVISKAHSYANGRIGPALWRFSLLRKAWAVAGRSHFWLGVAPRKFERFFLKKKRKKREFEMSESYRGEKVLHTRVPGPHLCAILPACTKQATNQPIWVDQYATRTCKSRSKESCKPDQKRGALAFAMMAFRFQSPPSLCLNLFS